MKMANWSSGQLSVFIVSASVPLLSIVSGLENNWTTAAPLEGTESF